MLHKISFSCRLAASLACFVFCVNTIYAQTTAGFDEIAIQQRVKQLDEFVKRFNYETDIQGKPIANQQDTLGRTRYILSLFDRDFIQKTSEKDKQTIKEFINLTCQNPVYLRFEDKDWGAEAKCRVKLNGKIETLTLFLQVEHIEAKHYKWVIADAQADFLSLKPEKPDLKTIISPVDNEISFMKLGDLISMYRTSVVKFAKKDFDANALSTVLWLIKQDILQIEYVEDLTYHFRQVPGFEFSVKHFERKDGNVGWLISKIEKR